MLSHDATRSTFHDVCASATACAKASFCEAFYAGQAAATRTQQAFITTAAKLPTRVPCFAVAAGCCVPSVKSCHNRLFATKQEQAKTAAPDIKFTWLVLGGDPAAQYHSAEQFAALWGLRRFRGFRGRRP
jgi:hypothetical protein